MEKEVVEKTSGYLNQASTQIQIEKLAKTSLSQSILFNKYHWLTFSFFLFTLITLTLSLLSSAPSAYAEADLETEVTALDSIGATQKEDPSLSEAESSSTWTLIKSKFRIGSFTEVMSPTFKDSNGFIPDPTGGPPYAPTNAYSFAWIDYEVAPNWRILYHQRFFVNFISATEGQGVNAFIRTPRFAIRRTKVFDNPYLTTTYDLYVQPGIRGFSHETVRMNRPIEGGFRTNTSYAFPKSKWTIGLLTEFTLTSDPKAQFYSWFASWGSYQLSSFISTQHSMMLNYQQLRNRPFGKLVWDDPKPLLQNGLGYNISKTVWAATMVNNYLLGGASWKHTWVSLWVVLSVL